MGVRDITNSFISIESVKERDSGSLNGMTFGIKDSIPVKGMRCTSGSRVMLNHVADKHSKTVQTILFNGGEISGKTNLHEFGVGATSTSSVMGPCRNPFDMDRICGGSSGGSAAAVAAGYVDVGVGTDTGGSIRIPASLCGVIGYKPSNMYARSDSEIPFSDIMETTGLITRDFTTLKWVVRELFPNIEDMDWSSDGIKIGILGESRDMNFSSFLDKVRSGSGRTTAEYANIPLLEKEGNRVRRLVSARDGYEAHKDMLKDHACDYFPDVRNVLQSGSGIEKSDYDEALSLRKEMVAQFNEVMYDYDVIVSQTTTITAPRILDVIGNEENYRESLIRNTELFNVVGAPSISIPSGFASGLPTGLMVSGAPGDDSKMLKIAEALNAVMPGKSSR